LYCVFNDIINPTLSGKDMSDFLVAILVLTTLKFVFGKPCYGTKTLLTDLFNEANESLTSLSTKYDQNTEEGYVLALASHSA